MRLALARIERLARDARDGRARSGVVEVLDAIAREAASVRRPSTEEREARLIIIERRIERLQRIMAASGPRGRVRRAQDLILFALLPERLRLQRDRARDRRPADPIGRYLARAARHNERRDTRRMPILDHDHEEQQALVGQILRRFQRAQATRLGEAPVLIPPVFVGARPDGSIGPIEDGAAVAGIARRAEHPEGQLYVRVVGAPVGADVQIFRSTGDGGAAEVARTTVQAPEPEPAASAPRAKKSKRWKGWRR